MNACLYILLITTRLRFRMNHCSVEPSGMLEFGRSLSASLKCSLIALRFAINIDLSTGAHVNIQLGGPSDHAKDHSGLGWQRCRVPLVHGWHSCCRPRHPGLSRVIVGAKVICVSSTMIHVYVQPRRERPRLLLCHWGSEANSRGLRKF